MLEGRDKKGSFIAGSPAVKKLARKGGKAKVPKGFAAMSPEKRREISLKALKKRWEKNV